MNFKENLAFISILFILLGLPVLLLLGGFYIIEKLLMSHDVFDTRCNITAVDKIIDFKISVGGFRSCSVATLTLSDGRKVVDSCSNYDDLTTGSTYYHYECYDGRDFYYWTLN
jgi:hypothetical protein